MKDDTRLILDLVRRGAEEASVCTEPAMIAFAAAKAREILGEPPTRIEASLSPGVMKNCLAVGLPGTDRRGPKVAAALGAALGTPEMGLRALRSVGPDTVREAHRLLDAGVVGADCDARRVGVYCLVRMAGAEHTAEVTIDGGHSRITCIKADGKAVVYTEGQSVEGTSRDDQSPAAVKRLSYERLFEVAISADEGEIQYLREGALSAVKLAQESLRGDGVFLDFPRALSSVLESDDDKAGHKAGCGLTDRARLGVAAAVSARMAGVVWPVLTSCGSGNQGISVSIPVLLAAGSVEAGPSREVRALLLAHATNLYIKAFMGTVSAVCGAISAGAGVAASVCWLMGGDEGQVEGAVQAVIGNLYGMVCDGAKGSCAMKCAAAVTEGILAAQVASKGVYPQGEAGIVGRSLKDTVTAMGSLSQVLNGVDPLIIGIRGSDH